MDNWNHLQAYANDKHKEMLAEARQQRLLAKPFSGIRRALVIFTVVVLGMLVFWVR
mgnify:CR=1 FL=1